MNTCNFSADRRYRYSLFHDLHPLLKPERKSWLAWIGLNPSKADEQQLDPTLRRIAAFTMANGYTGFVMLNLFAFVSTDPANMLVAADPIGTENDRTIFRECQQAGRVVCAWGANGGFRNRSTAVMVGLHALGVEMLAFDSKWTKSGEPRHPLYMAGVTPLVPLLSLAPEMVAA